MKSLDILNELDIPLWVRTSRLPSESELQATEVPDQPQAASSDSSWDTLRAEVAGCQQCPLHQTRTQTVFGVGSEQADLLIVGEAPGANEDRQGEPFVGRAGQLLNAMLKSIGLDRNAVFIANTLKCRPPNNRDPQENELAACGNFLDRQMALLQPKVILAVGRISAQILLETDQSLGKLRGRTHRYTKGDHNIPLLVTYHPAYLLRSPDKKPLAYGDLLDLKGLLGEG